jgi:hypothetical protein
MLNSGKGRESMAVKINKVLQYFSNFDPTKETKTVSLGTLCNEIEKGKVTLPIYQTYIRWKTEKSVELLNFQLKGKAAVSPVSMNIIENKDMAVQQVTFVERKLIVGDLKGIHSVNDGQQRLTCNYKAYIDHEEFRCVVLDIARGEFVINTGEIKKSQIPVGKLYNKDPKVFQDYLREHKELQDFEVQTLLTAIRGKFLSYYYIVNYAKDLTEEEQLLWFDVLNLAGSRVTGVMVEITEMLVKGVDFYKEYSESFGETLREASLEHLFVMKNTEISIPLAALNPAYEIVVQKVEHGSNFSPIPSDVKASLISKLEAIDIRLVFSITLKALDKVIDFIEDNQLQKPDRIDYVTYLIGAFVYNKGQQLTIEQRNYLIEWYNTVDFKSKGNTDRREIFDSLLSRMKELS